MMTREQCEAELEAYRQEPGKRSEQVARMKYSERFLQLFQIMQNQRSQNTLGQEEYEEAMRFRAFGGKDQYGVLPKRDDDVIGKVSSLPEAVMEELVDLREVTLRTNGILAGSFDFLQKMPKMEILNITGNHLKFKVSDTLDKMPDLKELRLRPVEELRDTDGLKHVPDGIKNLALQEFVWVGSRISPSQWCAGNLRQEPQRERSLLALAFPPSVDCAPGLSVHRSISSASSSSRRSEP